MHDAYSVQNCYSMIDDNEFIFLKWDQDHYTNLHGPGHLDLSFWQAHLAVVEGRDGR